jgi:hypothetical protein
MSDFDTQPHLVEKTLKAAVSSKDTGGSGGTAFTLTKQNHAVTKIEVWTDIGSNTKDGDFTDRLLVKDIELTWDDGSTGNVTGNHDGNSVDFDFNDKEKVTSMTIRTGARVDKIAFVTDKEEDGEYRTFSAGQNHGNPHALSVGKGILYGFHGHYDKSQRELVSLGAKFKN